MASVEKFTIHAVVNQLRHIERTIANPSNKDIDQTRKNQNYSLAPDRGMSSYDYFKQRKSELYCYNRDDVKVMASWIVTAPRDLPANQHRAFFKSTQLAFLLMPEEPNMNDNARFFLVNGRKILTASLIAFYQKLDFIAICEKVVVKNGTLFQLPQIMPLHLLMKILILNPRKAILRRFL